MSATVAPAESLPDTDAELSGRQLRTVVFAASLGTVFEWYDFYLYGALAGIIGTQFFSGVANPTSAFIFALLAFGAGFAVRPFGAIFFGRLGDLVGRKYTFLVTILIMGLSTFVVGILPSYARIGIAAPILLMALRLLQGLALGGEYGGAATYVAEHAPHGRRGEYTSWIQTTATLGLFLSLVVILWTRRALGTAAFDAWGWRIPFLVSLLLLAASVWIRLRLAESPLFRRMKSEGRTSAAPLTESFARWGNARLVLIALFGLTMGQAVVWYTGQFYTLFFLMQVLKVDAQRANLLIAASLVLGTPFFLVFGRLSDRIGRKRIIMAGLALAALTYFPIFRAITHFANPALEAAQAARPVAVIADPAECSVQFDPIGRRRFTTPCDVAKSTLTRKGIPYVNALRAPGDAERWGSAAAVRVGEVVVPSYSAAAPDAAQRGARFAGALDSALARAQYPAAADPAAMNQPMLLLLLTILVIYVTMVYAPIAAMLVEMFPTRIRYTSMSLPYHIGNGWFGGLLPVISFSIVAARGSIYAGLWYPVGVALATLVIGLRYVPETKDVDIRET